MPTGLKLVFKDGIDRGRIAWGRSDSQVSAICSWCCGAPGQSPLRIWKTDGRAAQFCDNCVADIFEVVNKS